MRWHTIFVHMTFANSISTMLRGSTVRACLCKAFFVAISISNGWPGCCRIAVWGSGLHFVVREHAPAARRLSHDFSRMNHLTRCATGDLCIHRRSRRMESRRRIDEARDPIPLVPSAWRPAPTPPADKYPTAITVWHPAPRIRGNPRWSEASIGIVAIAGWLFFLRENPCPLQ